MRRRAAVFDSGLLYSGSGEGAVSAGEGAGVVGGSDGAAERTSSTDTVGGVECSGMAAAEDELIITHLPHGSGWRN